MNVKKKKKSKLCPTNLYAHIMILFVHQIKKYLYNNLRDIPIFIIIFF